MNPEENKGQENTSSPSVAPVATNPAPRITESKLEAAHATLPPMSVIGASTEPAVKPGTIPTPKQFGRRGTPSNVAPSGKTANSRPSIGVIENPAQVTESLSGELAKQPRPTHAAPAAHQAPREPRHEQQRFERDSRPPYRAPREPREPHHLTCRDRYERRIDIGTMTQGPLRTSWDKSGESACLRHPRACASH